MELVELDEGGATNPEEKLPWEKEGDLLDSGIEAGAGWEGWELVKDVVIGAAAAAEDGKSLEEKEDEAGDGGMGKDCEEDAWGKVAAFEDEGILPDDEDEGN